MIFKIRLLVILSFSLEIYSKKVFIRKNSDISIKEKLKVVKLQKILEENKEISLIKVLDSFYFKGSDFSISSKFPKEGYFDDLFVLSIPQGKVFSRRGHVFIGEKIVEEFVWDQRYDLLQQDLKNKEKCFCRKIQGKVAVISQFGYNNYFHFLNEMLGRLALLEMSNVKYDWLYISDEMPYAPQLLELWGIDSSKIISIKYDTLCIEAEELIVPSLVSNTTAGHNHAGSFIHPIIMEYVKDKLLQAAFKKNIDTSRFSKKIFISRKDAYASRRILNEDEIFEWFKEKDFAQYELSKMSIVEQIMLFAQAEVIVSEQGSGLTNILFCKPGAKIYEIFQAMVDNCFWWQSHVNKLQYFPFLTIPVDVDYFANCKMNIMNYQKAWQSQINIPIDSVISILNDL